MNREREGGGDFYWTVVENPCIAWYVGQLVMAYHYALCFPTNNCWTHYLIVNNSWSWSFQDSWCNFRFKTSVFSTHGFRGRGIHVLQLFLVLNCTLLFLLSSHSNDLLSWKIITRMMDIIVYSTNMHWSDSNYDNCSI